MTQRENHDIKDDILSKTVKMTEVADLSSMVENERSYEDHIDLSEHNIDVKNGKDSSCNLYDKTIKDKTDFTVISENFNEEREMPTFEKTKSSQNCKDNILSKETLKLKSNSLSNQLSYSRTSNDDNSSYSRTSNILTKNDENHNKQNESFNPEFIEIFNMSKVLVDNDPEEIQESEFNSSNNSKNRLYVNQNKIEEAPSHSLFVLNYNFDNPKANSGDNFDYNETERSFIENNRLIEHQSLKINHELEENVEYFKYRHFNPQTSTDIKDEFSSTQMNSLGDPTLSMIQDFIDYEKNTQSKGGSFKKIMRKIKNILMCKCSNKK